MEDEHPHELSTITEVDTPVTSRLNTTEMANAVDQSTIANRTQEGMNDSQCKALLQMLYNRFPDFHEYIRSISNIAQASETTATSEKLGHLMSADGHLSALNYQSFHPSHNPENLSLPTSFTYGRFPSHSEYARDATGLLDSQSIEQLQVSEKEEDPNTNSSSLPDIVSELRSRNLKHSFEIESDDEHSLNKDPKTVTDVQAASTVEKLGSGSLSDTLEKQLQEMGINWASSMIKKSKQVEKLSASTSTTSSASENSSHLMQRSAKKAHSPQKPPRASKSPRKSTRTNDSSVDINFSTTQATVISQACEGNPVNLKDFLARELMKHSSTSSSSDSSLASIFLKSFLGHSSSHHSAAVPPTPLTRTSDKHRTSTPVNVESGNGTRSVSLKKPSPLLEYQSLGISPDDTQNANDLTNKLFSGESHLSSVHINSSDSDGIDTHQAKARSEQQKHADFEQHIAPAALRLNLAGPSSSSTTTTSN